jgi:hypothetical protein
VKKLLFIPLMFIVAFAYCDSVKITYDIDRTTDTVLSNYPIPIVLTNSTPNIGSFFSDTASDGSDIYFNDSDDATELVYERVKFIQSTSSGVFVGYVVLPTISTGTTNPWIYMHYNDGTAYDHQCSSATWDSDYIAVLHCEETPVSSGYPFPENAYPIKDSTRFQHDTSCFGSMTSSNLVTDGKIGNALYFNGSGNYIQTGGINGAVIYYSSYSTSGLTLQGVCIDTSSAFVYVAENTNIFKYSYPGFVYQNISTTWTAAPTEQGIALCQGDICYYDNHIWSVMTDHVYHSTITYVYKYDEDLNFVDSYYLGSDTNTFAYYPGGLDIVSTGTTHVIYMVEAANAGIYDRITRWTTDFTYIDVTVTSNISAFGGAQCIKYNPWEDCFQINSHASGICRIASNLSNTSIRAVDTPISQNQGACFVSSTTMIYCDRINKSLWTAQTSFNNTDLYTQILNSSASCISMWFYATTGPGVRRCLTETVGNYSLSLEVNTTNLKYSMNLAVGELGGIDTGVAVSSGTWFKVDFVWLKNNYSKVYVNGVQKTTASLTGTGMVDLFGKLNIGTYRDATSRFWPGYIDEYRLSKSIRTPAQIFVDYNIESEPTGFITLEGAPVTSSGGINKRQSNNLIIRNNNEGMLQ